MAEKLQNTQIFMIFAQKVNKIAEFYMTFVRKVPEFYIIIAQKIFPEFFFGGGHVPPALPLAPPSPLPPHLLHLDYHHLSSSAAMTNYLVPLQIQANYQ